MSLRRPRAVPRAALRSNGRDRFPWFAWLVLATMLVVGAALGHAASVPQSPGPATSAPTKSGETQQLVPAAHAPRTVIQPPAIDPGIRTPAPPARIFPTPVIKPPPTSPQPAPPAPPR
jgi:hypothetical protein